VNVPNRAQTDATLIGPNLRLRIGEHVVDTGALRVVTRPELPRLTMKAVAVLVELVRDVGQTVTRDQLLDRVWTGRFPTPDVLTQAIKELRRAFADDSKPPRYIETIPKLGYRLIASVSVLEAGERVPFDTPREPMTAIDEDVAEIPSREPAQPAVDSPMSLPQPSSIGTSPSPPLRSRWPFVATTALFVLVAIVATAFVVGRVRVVGIAAAPAAPEWKVGSVRALTSAPGAERRPNLSPDGKRVAFATSEPGSVASHIVVRSVEGSQVVRITSGTQPEAFPQWSPDGTRIAFQRQLDDGCAIFVASGLGGDEREVSKCRAFNVTYYDWTPDGRGLITAQSRKPGANDLALAIVDLDSGERRFLDYAHADKDQDLEPHYSPDGRSIAFRRGIAPYSDLYVMSADGGAVRQVTHIASRIRGHEWTRDGSALIFASNFSGAMALYAVDVEIGRLQPLGIAPAEYPASARDDDLVAYEIPRTRNQLTEVSLDGASKPRTFAPSTGSDYAPAVSPTGDRLAFVSDRSGQYQVWLEDISSGVVSPLTDAPENPMLWPRWSQDGTRVVAVQLSVSGARQLVEIDVASRRQRTLSRAEDNVLLGAFGVDADSYVMATGASASDDSLVLVRHPGEAGETRQLIASGVAFMQVDAASRAIYYTTTNGEGLYRYAIDGGQTRFVSPIVSSLTTNGWRVVDGRIWYVAGIEMRPIVLHELDPETGEERELGRFDASLRDVNFSAAPNGRIVLSVIGSEDTDVGAFTLMRDEP
jgi:Tol biopolymer transport system component/DNA-binding winged helix-turn-helix (wHTH) protein